MERRSWAKDPPLGPTETAKKDEMTDADAENFRKKELAKQFEDVKSLETQKLSASELNTFATAKKIVKLVTMLVVFLVVLSATVVSKVNQYKNYIVHI